jgi:hypothetical protein
VRDHLHPLHGTIVSMKVGLMQGMDATKNKKAAAREKPAAA